MTFPDRWHLEICRTCGRRAVWPFCEHKGNNGGDWFVTIIVTGKVPEKERR